MPTRGEPEQSYFPSSRARLSIRFEEFGQATRLQPPPAKLAHNLKGVKEERGPLTPTKVTDASGASSYVLLPPGAVAPSKVSPQNQGRSPDGLTFDLDVIPRESDWGQNGIRTADTLAMAIKWIDAPFDPRCIRSCAVEWYLGCVTSEDYVLGIEGGTRYHDEAARLVPDDYTDGAGRPRTNSRFKGFVDSWDVDMDDNAEPIIHLECTDNTRLMLDTERPSGLVLSGEVPIDEAVATYLSHFAAFAGLTVEYRPGGVRVPRLKEAIGGSNLSSLLGPPPSGGAGEGHSVMDYFVDVCGSIAHKVFIDGAVLVIQSVHTLTSRNVVRRTDDPFQGRDVGSGGFDYRRFICGRNVKKFRLRRNYAKRKTENIEVRAYDCTGTTKRPIVGRFPEPKDRQNFALPGGGGTDQKWKVIPVSGISDPATLKRLAQQIYEEQGRNEIECEIVTHNLASLGGGNLDPDILDMKFGDKFEVLSERARPGTEPSTPSKIETILELQEKTEELFTALGMSPGLAKAYGAAYSDAGFLTIFLLKTMKIHHTQTDGVMLSLRGVNCITIRAEKVITGADAEPLPVATGARATLESAAGAGGT